MRSFLGSAALVLAASSLTVAAPAAEKNTYKAVQLPLSDGFPFKSPPSKGQLAPINAAAFGTLSNLNPPASLKPDTLTSLRLVAFNELFEVFYFTNFRKRLDEAGFVSGSHGIDIGRLKVQIDSIIAVEKLHAINANNALVKVGKVAPIQPCKYKFTPTNVVDALKLANTFTDLVEGVLQDVVLQAATSGDAGFTRGVVASAEDEGEQNGGFRLQLGQARAQSQPFHTLAAREFAFSALQDFVVDGSCPNGGDVGLTVFQPLNLAKPVTKLGNQEVHFTFTLDTTRDKPQSKSPKVNSLVATNSKGQPADAFIKSLSITYLSGQNIQTVPIKRSQLKKGVYTVAADFPQKDLEAFGLTVAVVTKSTPAGGFQNAKQVVDATIFAPALIEVYDN